MKRLLLVRHAKSSWDVDADDFDRPLNHRGNHDAPAMAERLIKNDVKIDAFISSPAKRALSTATYFAEAYGIKPKHIITVAALYEPTVQAFANAIEDIDDEYKRVMIFSHNPAITDFANTLTATKVDDMPTCAIYAVKADVKEWKEFAGAEKEFWFFDYPKAG